MTNSLTLEEIYTNRYTKFLIPMSKKLEEYFSDIISGYPRVDRICARPKEIDSFLTKAKNEIDGKLKYRDPINDIFDQIGVRVIVNYKSDLDPICGLIEKFFGPIEKQRKEPERDDEFGYEGYHYILFIPQDLFTPEFDYSDCPKFFELQVKTLFQHAWAQADHDLSYKSQIVLDKEQKKKIAFTAAQAWGADIIFDSLFKTIHTQATKTNNQEEL